MEMDYNTIIIGSGVAGMTAAIYLKRAGVSVCIVEKDAPGGTINRTSSIENYPGFTSISGPDLATNMFMQVYSLKVDYKYFEVLKVEKYDNHYEIIGNNKNLKCKNIIVATGKSPRKLKIDSIDKYIGKGISFCAVCDGPLFKEKNVIIVGGGQAALEEALYLSKICSTITLIHRSDTFNATNDIVDKVKETHKINLIKGEISDFIGNEIIEKVILKDNQEIEVDGVFIYIGADPNTNFLNELNILDDSNYVVVDSNFESPSKGLYAVGDCLNKKLYQIINACSEGAVAANNIINKELI